MYTSFHLYMCKIQNYDHTLTVIFLSYHNYVTYHAKLMVLLNLHSLIWHWAPIDVQADLELQVLHVTNVYFSLYIIKFERYHMVIILYFLWLQLLWQLNEYCYDISCCAVDSLYLFWMIHVLFYHISYKYLGIPLKHTCRA